MSEYAYVQAEFTFDSEDSLESVVEKLQPHIDQPESEWIDMSQMVVQIPYNNYRNLHRHIEELAQYASGVEAVGASADGSFYGFVYTGGSYSETNLYDWASENGFEDVEDKKSMSDFEQHVEWTEDVMQAYMDTHQPDVS